MANFATTADLAKLWRPLKPGEVERAEALLEVVSDSLRSEAIKVGKDLDMMVAVSSALASVAKSVTVDVVARTLMTSTNQEPMTQFAESALGYSVQGSFLVPGGGLFIKDSELRRLGLKRWWIYMALIKGITVTLIDKVSQGEDPFGAPNYQDKEIEVENVLVMPASSDDIVNELNLTGKKAVYTLAIPKGDSHDWEDKEVRFFSQRWRTFGFVTQGIEDLIPLDWNKKVMVERYG